MPQYRVRATAAASPEIVWALLVDGRSWPRWSSGLDELVEERSSGLDPNGSDGVGAVRAFRTGRVVTGERLTELVPVRRFGYTDEFNLAMKEYRAVIELRPADEGGTLIDWSGTWRSKPGLGWITPLILPKTMQRMADDLAAHAAETQHSR
ncbi:SRPBCC family protein [Glycomyces harbinensis]|uniref:Polyketide cyclase / dehydrase and lipid transport n=1 Tax=Glycomyces harbinensis TaxID=58114 RepID=A0A1G6ZL53_9ACTN|nr:SRPBCC family protein [Glycomyces harbinensis]SDE03388.1 Polyketide cyclase / dehydrase and lipid transport [Glycomyces harbinensis]